MPYNRLGDLQTLTLNNEAKCDNACCILTLDNLVTLMGNVTITNYVANSEFALLPSPMRSIEETRIPVCLDNEVVVMTISTSGSMSLSQDVVSGTLYLNGVTFNCCGQYYNSTIGNNFYQGTAPLRWDGSDW